jgi:hypothetical protein
MLIEKKLNEVKWNNNQQNNQQKVRMTTFTNEHLSFRRRAPEKMETEWNSFVKEVEDMVGPTSAAAVTQPDNWDYSSRKHLWWLNRVHYAFLVLWPILGILLTLACWLDC